VLSTRCARLTNSVSFSSPDLFSAIFAYTHGNIERKILANAVLFVNADHSNRGLYLVEMSPGPSRRISHHQLCYCQRAVFLVQTATQLKQE
jgi:hypothetical protein